MEAYAKIQAVLGSFDDTVSSQGDAEIREKQRYLARVDTFQIGTWFAKPAELSPVACARRGWRNVQSDMLECEACVAKLDCTIDPMLDPEEVGKMADELVKQLTDHHTDGCAWREKVCPERFSDGPTGVHAKAGLQARCQALMQAQDKLPRLIFKDATHSKRMLHIAHGVLNRGGGGSRSRTVAGAGTGAGTGAGGNDNDGSVMASYMLALCGWQAEAQATTGTGTEGAAAAPSFTSAASSGLVLQCGFCRMMTTVNATNVVQWPPKQGSSMLIVDPPAVEAAATTAAAAAAAAAATATDGGGAAVSFFGSADNESPEPRPKLERQLTPKQSERRFGVPVGGDRQRLKRMLSGSSDTSPSKKRVRAVAVAVAVAVDTAGGGAVDGGGSGVGGGGADGLEIDPTKIHRSYCPYLDDGFKALVAANTVSDAGGGSGSGGGGGGQTKKGEDSAQAALRLVRSL